MSLFKEIIQNINKQLLFTFWVVSSITIFAQFPPPDVFYHFDETMGNIIEDHSGNGHHAWWYNYNLLDPGTTERTGWRPTEGRRGGAGYFAGDHVYCPNPCSAGSDLIVLATSDRIACDDEIPAHNDIFQQKLTHFTWSFWFKNDWNYLCEPGEPAHQCFEDNSGCAWERQVLLSTGWSNTGLILETFTGTSFPALIRLTIAGGDKEKRVTINANHPPFYKNKWVHYAIVFEGDGENSGNVKLYLDGILYSTANKDTEFGFLPLEGSMSAFGAQTGNSVTDFNIRMECRDNVSELCGVTEEQVGRLRYGWLARGWIDDLAFWSNKSLTQEELTAFNESLTTSIINQTKTINFSIAPSISNGTFRIENINAEYFDIEIFNSLGQSVSIINNTTSGQEVILPQHMKNGIYFVRLRNQDLYSVAKRIFLAR
jgi:hypothetical protein